MKTNEILENEASNQATRRPAALNRVKQLFAASVLAAAAFAATGNAHALPIKNGGFETGDLTGWSTMPVYFDGGVTSADAYGGSYCLELGPVDIVYQDVTTLKRFGSLTFMTKRASYYANAAYATVEYYDGSESEIMFVASGDWTAFEVPLDSTKRVARVSFWIGESPSIYIDHVALLDP